MALGNLVRHSAPSAEVARFVRQHGLQALQGGERECLYLARDTGSTMLLTDDLAAREAAGRLGLAPVGSLGIVVRAYQLGRLYLTEAEHLIRALHGRSSLFVTSAIAELAIERLRSSP